MNKIQDGWVMVEKSNFSCYENENHKKMFDEVKSTGWAIISFTDLSASDVNTNSRMSNTWLTEQKKNECSQARGPSGPMWYNISLND